MPNIGGRCPIPLRLGGGKSMVQTIYESLNQGLGTAYDTSDESTVTAETDADARSIAGVWRANDRLTNQWDPNRMTDFLARWEKIFALAPLSADTDNERRARVANKFLALGGPLFSTTSLICSNLLGSAFVGVEYTPLASANIHWPGGGEPNAWSSSVAHVLIRVAQPSTMEQPEFIALMGELMAFLGDYFSAWTTYDWAIFNSTGASGFLLDETNLDYESFD